MKLHEYQSKRIFTRYGLPVPQGNIATTPSEARQIAHLLGRPVVVKAQVLAGGRGKAGGIRLARDAAEAEEAARQIIGMSIKGLTVHKVLVECAAEIDREMYMGIVIDRTRRKPVMIVSAQGGVEIEELARNNPDAIFRLLIDPLRGLMDYQARNLAFDLGLHSGFIRPFTAIAHDLWRVFVENDAILAEINPLVITPEGQMIAVDGKITLDDNALFRHLELSEMRDVQEETEAQRQARQADLSYVKLNGDIGCMVNGAGLAMATMDLVDLYGGRPANFLDIGGGAKANKVAAALRIILSDQDVKVILINIFGGITRCDEVARGLLAAIQEAPTSVPPMVVRLVGANEEEGRQLLATADIITATSLIEAAQKAVALATGC
ncbi:MAG: ADP-forming succinate--CoA ligase subunit beta [Anaerolineae bacterium]